MSNKSRRVVMAVIVLLALIAPTTLNAARRRPNSGLRAQAQARLDELRAGAEFPGAVAAFVLPDGTAVTVATGYADLESKSALTATHRLLAGSIGKTFVAAVAMQLVDEGRLDLDKKIAHWFAAEPWFKRLPNAEAITVRMLMNHTSGIPEHVLDKSFIAALKAQPDRVWSGPELLAYILDREPLFAAGQGWSYADTNYILVGMIIEKITANSFYRELTRRVLKPLRLANTVPSDSRTIAGLSTGYCDPRSPFAFPARMLEGGKIIVNPQFEWTGGGLASNAQDLARWAKALYEARVFSRVRLAEMLESVEAKTGKGDRYGLGVQVRQSEWGVTYGHGGWFPGYLSEMEYFPEHGIAVAIQFNTDSVKQLKRSPHALLLEMARVVMDAAAKPRKAA